MAYAELADLDNYVKGSVDGLWQSDSGVAEDSLFYAFREINDRLRGLDRFADSDIPVAEESDGRYAEVLVRLNVYVAVYNQVASTHAGEIFEDHWAWLRKMISDIWTGIEKGTYSFGSDPAASSSSAKAIELGRASP